MNEHITDFINYYKTLDDPRYAVLLSGVWGCGKTHFIKRLLNRWDTSSSSNREEDDNIVIKPIYITLNGVSSIKTVNYLIEKELSPFLNSKVMQTFKKIALGAIKLTTKINLDFNNDGKDDGSVSAEFNSVDLLTSNSNKIKGNKLLIFDDIERSKIETDELLGYLNQFVEHHKCKIILIGDEDKIKKLYDKQESKIHYREFKEKLIGQTFTLKIDIDNALDEFIKDCSDEANAILSLHKHLIKDTFQTTAINNLRLLRQCLLEFDRFIKNIDNNLKNKEEYKEFIRQVLAYFIIGYCEYKSGNESIQTIDNPTSAESKEMNEKYADFRSSGRFRSSYYTLPFQTIIEYVKQSYIDKALLNKIIIESECFRRMTLQSWEKLWYYDDLDNNEFLSLYKEVKDQFLNLQVDTIPELLQISGILLSIQQNGFGSLKKETIISKSKKNIDCIFKKYSSSIEYETKAETVSYGKECRSSQTDGFNKIFLYADKKYQKEAFLFRDNKMKIYFENLTDTSLDTIFTLLNESLPDRSRPYSMTSIFQSISVDKLAKCIVLLSNRSKYYFAQFIARRYYLEGSGHGGTIYKYHTDDLDTLVKLKSLLERKVKRLKLMDKKAINVIIDKLTPIITILDREKGIALDQ